jgi:serine/threonine protein kinase
MPLNDGEVFAGYTILRLLGSGGMGDVYLAQHPRLPRQDALKILPGGLTADNEFRQRFNREADLAAQLWHPHIVGVHDRGEFEGQLWISMDYVDGTDAGRLLRTRDQSGMPLADVVEIVSAVADALDYAHSRGMLHRDVKPANILLGNAGGRGRRILLADFGIARQVGDISGLTETNMAVGTVAYSAPEQLMGSEIDGRADEYALGCTAFQLLTGSVPFQQSNPAVVISLHLSSPPPAVGDARPELAGLDAVIARAMAKSPGDRYASCSDFAAALSGQPHTAPTGAPADGTALRHSAPVTAPRETATTVAAPVTEPATTAITQPTSAMVPLQATPPPPRARRRLLRPVTVITAIVAVAVVAGAIVLGARLHRAPSNEPGAASPAPQLSILLNRYITDRSGVLTPANRLAIQNALTKLYNDRKVHLWVAYVPDFANIGPQRWGQNTVHDNAFTDTDALLAIATDRRLFAFPVPAAILNGTVANRPDWRQNHIQSAVVASDWTGAAIAAANGLDTLVGKQ